MSQITCAEVEELAPELALATLPGDQRAAVLAHLDGCGDCRRLVRELSDTADALLLAVPAAAPSAGFARRVTRALGTPRTRLLRPVAAAAALALVAGLALGLLPSLLRGSGSTPVRVASFKATAGETLGGQVYARADNPSWVFMTVRDPRQEGDGGETYTCELVLRNGDHMRIGSFTMRSGSGSWGRAVAVNADDVATVTLLNAQGAIAATAVLSG